MTGRVLTNSIAIAIIINLNKRGVAASVRIARDSDVGGEGDARCRLPRAERFD